MLTKILKKSLQIIPFIFFALAFFMIIQVLIAVKSDKTPTIFGYSVFLVVSPSMEDTIMTGDIIFVDTTDFSYVEDDIITFHQPTDEVNIITHRIDKIETINGITYITTKGDNNHDSLEWEKRFTTDYVIGVYKAKSTALGNIYQFVYQGGVGLIYGAVILIFVIIGVSEAISIVKLLSKHRAEEIQKQRQELIEQEKEKIRKELDDKDKK